MYKNLAMGTVFVSNRDASGVPYVHLPWSVWYRGCNPRQSWRCGAVALWQKNVLSVGKKVWFVENTPFLSLVAGFIRYYVLHNTWRYPIFVV
jgi:hypothetical protein